MTRRLIAPGIAGLDQRFPALRGQVYADFSGHLFLEAAVG